MGDIIGSQKNILPKKHPSGSISRLKKIFSYLLFLSILESGAGYAQPKSTKNENTADKIENMTTVSDHKKLIDTNVDSLDIETIRKELLTEINQERAKDSLKPLVLDSNLNNAAMKYAQYMSKNNRYHHNDKNGITPSKRIELEGCEDVFMGEDIHKGPRSIYYVMKDRMGSALHANNILGEYAEKIGIGYYDGYRVIDLAGRYTRIKRESK